MFSTSSDIENWVASLASQLVEAKLGEFIFVGIVRGGDVLARRLSSLIEQQTGYSPPVYHIDITLYRDDLYTGLEHPTFGGTHLPISVDGTRIILVDDVLFTGRTIRAAMQEIMDYGRPAWMKLLVLIDRNGRELPIQPDFYGKQVHCAQSTKVRVEISVDGHQDSLVIQEGIYDKS